MFSHLDYSIRKIVRPKRPEVNRAAAVVVLEQDSTIGIELGRKNISTRLMASYHPSFYLKVKMVQDGDFSKND